MSWGSGHQGQEPGHFRDHLLAPVSISRGAGGRLAGLPLASLSWGSARKRLWQCQPPARLNPATRKHSLRGAATGATTGPTDATAATSWGSQRPQVLPLPRGLLLSCVRKTMEHQRGRNQRAVKMIKCHHWWQLGWIFENIMLCEKVRWKKIEKHYFTHVWDRKQKLTNNLRKQIKTNS